MAPCPVMIGVGHKQILSIFLHFFPPLSFDVKWEVVREGGGFGLIWPGRAFSRKEFGQGSWSQRGRGMSKSLTGRLWPFLDRYLSCTVKKKFQ